jgi:hypothetical protein
MNKILKKKGIIFILIFLLIVLLLNIYFAFYINEFDNTSGVFGDSWGFSNAIFSLIATLFIIISIYKQGEEIKDQSFDSSLMSLINNHIDLTSHVSVETKSKIINGKNTFKYHFLQVQHNDLDEIRNYFKKYLREDFGHYFSNIYRILKYIDVNKSSKKNSHYNNEHDPISYPYAAIFRSQFTVYELFWLQAHIDDKINNVDHENNKRVNILKNLIEKFCFLKNATLNDKYNKVFRFNGDNELEDVAYYVPQAKDE